MIKQTLSKLRLRFFESHIERMEKTVDYSIKMMHKLFE